MHRKWRKSLKGFEQIFHKFICPIQITFKYQFGKTTSAQSKFALFFHFVNQPLLEQLSIMSNDI